MGIYRDRILAALIGIVLSAVTIYGIRASGPHVQPPAWHAGHAINNQCPVCGTMCKPVRPQREGNSEVAKAIVRCDRCNSAFWADAEGK